MKMLSIPYLKRMNSDAQLAAYQTNYLSCSGLPVPMEYLKNRQNRVYTICFGKQVIGGFILGHGEIMRTLEVFAQADSRKELYANIRTPLNFTEITCFWINPTFRNHTTLNTFVWLSLAYTLKRFGQPNILFGTCSSSLARLYGVTPKSQLIHKDFVNGKRTFIFQSTRKESLQGFIEILQYKINRVRAIKRKRNQRPQRTSILSTQQTHS